MAANNQLQADAEVTQVRSDKTRELNRRLCRDVNEARSERTVALEDLDRLKQQVEFAQQDTKQAQQDLKQVQMQNFKLGETLRTSEQQAQLDLQQVRMENLSLREALKASQQEVLELSIAQCDTASELSTGNSVSGALDGISTPSNDSGPDPAILVVPLAQEDCTCSDHFTWGCPSHRVYSDSLLLAHRDIATRISNGPPGLEMDAPPGLEVSFHQRQPSWDNKLSLAPAW